MKHFRVYLNILVLLALLLPGCAQESTGGKKEFALSPPEPNCTGEACIHGAHVFLDTERDMLIILFDIKDPQGEVKMDPKLASFLNEELNIKAYKLNPQGEGQHLFGEVIRQDSYRCVASKEFAWANGQLSVACGINQPLKPLTMALQKGDLVRVALQSHGFQQDVLIKTGQGWPSIAVTQVKPSPTPSPTPTPIPSPTPTPTRTPRPTPTARPTRTPTPTEDLSWLPTVIPGRGLAYGRVLCRDNPYVGHTVYLLRLDKVLRKWYFYKETTTNYDGYWYINSVNPGDYADWAAGRPSGTINTTAVHVSAGESQNFGVLNLNLASCV